MAVIKSLKKVTNNDKTIKDKENSSKYIAGMESKINKLFSVTATIPELIKMGGTISHKLFPKKNDVLLSKKHHLVIRKYWADSVNKIIKDLISEQIQEKIVRFWIECNKNIEHYPIVEYLNE